MTMVFEHVCSHIYTNINIACNGSYSYHFRTSIYTVQNMRTAMVMVPLCFATQPDICGSISGMCACVCVGLRAAEPECDSSRFIYCTYCVSHGYNKCHLFCSSNYIMHRQRLHEWNGTRYVRFSWRYIHMKYIYCYDIRFT